MLRSALIFLSVSLVLLVPVPSLGTALHDLGGSWARYQVVADPASLPRIDTLVLSTPRIEATPDGDAVWFQMEAFWQRTRVFALAMLVSDVSFLEGAGAPAVVHRYILLPENGDPLEYVDAATGRALLPRFGLFDGLLPVAQAGAAAPLFELEEFLGRPLVLERSSPAGAKMVSDFAGLSVLELDDRVLIGSSRHFRDDGTGREVDYQYMPPQPGDYRYVHLGKADYEEMIDAGFNLFRLPIRHLDWVLAEPVFFLLYDATYEVPDLLYRSNYRGGVMYMDEPEIGAGRQDSWGDIVTPEVAAQAIIDYTREMLLGSTKYGSGYLAEVLTREHWNLGPRVELAELAMPSWIAYCGTGWYQKEAGVRDLVLQCRTDPVDHAASLEQRLAVSSPAEAEPWIRFELAMATGATRHFGGDWGVSVFGQMDEVAADLLFPMAYERGARYFWVWTSARDHHVPHARQLEIVRNFRDWLASEPGFRPRESRPLVAITLPWGYNCDRSNFKWDDPGMLWWRTQIRLDEQNTSGVEHRNVLAALYRTYLERIDAGEEVDFVYERAGEIFPAEGYDAVYRVLPTGIVQAGATTSPVATPSSALPLRVWPNPCSEGASLRLDVPHGVVAGVHVYDAAGRLIRTVLPQSRLAEGPHAFWWNGRDEAGRRVSAGVYFARAVVGESEVTSKVVLLR